MRAAVSNLAATCAEVMLFAAASLVAKALADARAGLAGPPGWAAATVGQIAAAPAAARVEPATTRVSLTGLRLRVRASRRCAASGRVSLERWLKTAGNAVGLWCRDKICLWSSALSARFHPGQLRWPGTTRSGVRGGTLGQGDGGIKKAAAHAGCCQPSSLPSDSQCTDRNGH